jgi:hypothetical protein
MARSRLQLGGALAIMEPLHAVDHRHRTGTHRRYGQGYSQRPPDGLLFGHQLQLADQSLAVASACCRAARCTGRPPAGAESGNAYSFSIASAIAIRVEGGEEHLDSLALRRLTGPSTAALQYAAASSDRHPGTACSQPTGQPPDHENPPDVAPVHRSPTTPTPGRAADCRLAARHAASCIFVDQQPCRACSVPRAAKGTVSYLTLHDVVGKIGANRPWSSVPEYR